MTDKLTRLGIVGICPEVTKGVPNWKGHASGGTTGTVTLDTAAAQEHNEALATMPDNFLNGCKVLFKDDTTTAALRGKTALVTASQVSGGTLTLTLGSTLPGTPASGDKFYMYAPVKASGVSIAPKTELLIPETYESDVLDPSPGVPGLDRVSGSFTLEAEGLEQEIGDGDTPRADSLSVVGRMVGTVRRPSGGTTVSGSGSTTTVIDVADASGLEEGDVVFIDGRAAVVDSIDTASTPDNITVSPALPAAPADGTEVFVGETITPDDRDHESATVLSLRDTQLRESRGCMFSLGLSGTFGSLASIPVEFDGSGWAIEDSFSFAGALQGAQRAIPFIQGRANFGSTALCAHSLDFALNHARSETKDTCAGNEYKVLSREATASVSFRNADKTPATSWASLATQGRLLVQIGAAIKNVIGVYGNAQLSETPSFEDVEGLQYWGAAFRFVDPRTSTTKLKPVIFRV